MVSVRNQRAIVSTIRNTIAIIVLIAKVTDIAEEQRPVSKDPAVSARMMITYFRGALYGWAAGFYSDEEFEKQVRLAGRLTVPDAT